MYALDFSRMFPPDLAQDHLPGGVFYQLFRPEFVRKYYKPLCSDSWTSFMARSESAESIRDIKEAHGKLMEITADFGKQLAASERPQVNLEEASVKLVNLMHMNGINMRYLGQVWLACEESPYWRLVVLLEMIVRRLKRKLSRRLRTAVLSQTSGVSACVATALKFLNVVFGESDQSTDFWQMKIRTSVLEYFFHGHHGEYESGDGVGAATISWKASVVNSEHGRVLSGDVRAQLLSLLCVKTGLRLGELTRDALKNNPLVMRVEMPFDDADLEDLGVSVTYLPIASFSGAKLKRLTAMQCSRRGKAYELNLQASRLYMQALRMNPADPQLLRNCAETEALLGNNAKADEFFRLAMSVDPKDEGTAFKYAIFYDSSLQLGLAEKWYLRALDCFQKPSHRVPVMMATYADFLLTERRNVPLAQSLYELVLAKHPTHVQTAHNLAVLLFETDKERSKALFKIALDNAEDDSRVALISRSCASFHMAIDDVAAGMRFYQRYKELKHLVSDHPPSLYHATRSIFGPEMNEIREIIGSQNQFKVRHLFWDELDEDESGRNSGRGLQSSSSPSASSTAKLLHRLQRSVQRLFQRLQVPCSSEISYISVPGEQIPVWVFDEMDREAFVDEYCGIDAAIGVVVGYQDGDGYRCFEEELAGTIVASSVPLEETTGWSSIFRVKGFAKTLHELQSHRAMLNVRRRAYLRLWSGVESRFEEEDEEDESAHGNMGGSGGKGMALRRSMPARTQKKNAF